jgi:hypothetical protein
MTHLENALRLIAEDSTGLVILPESHMDHGLSKDVLDYIVDKYKDRAEFFIDTFTLPGHLGQVPSGIYGPIVGDPPVEEEDVYYAKRGDRAYPSRMVPWPVRESKTITVIAGPHGNHKCVLYTAFGGPLTPREPGDPQSDAESEKFWSEHALAAGS